MQWFLQYHIYIYCTISIYRLICFLSFLQSQVKIGMAAYIEIERVNRESSTHSDAGSCIEDKARVNARRLPQRKAIEISLHLPRSVRSVVLGVIGTLQCHQ